MLTGAKIQNVTVGKTGPLMVMLCLFASLNVFANKDDVERIMVTGSKIVRSGDSVSSAVFELNHEALTNYGVITVEETLNHLPQFAEGATAGTVSIGGGGGATLNMRALGSNRNLVLMNQRRLPVSSPFGSVDINILPRIIIEQVDMLTNGASSIYGSEAISGVVNFHSFTRFDKTKLSVSYGDSQLGGSERQEVSFITGLSGADEKFNAVIALGLTDREALRGEERDFFRFAIPSSFIGQGTYRSGGNAPDQDAVNALFNSYGFNALPSTDRLGFNDDGTLFTQFDGALNYKGPIEDDSLFWVRNGEEVRQPVGRQGTVLKGLKRSNTYFYGDLEVTDTSKL